MDGEFTLVRYVSVVSPLDSGRACAVIVSLLKWGLATGVLSALAGLVIGAVCGISGQNLTIWSIGWGAISGALVSICIWMRQSQIPVVSDQGV